MPGPWARRCLTIAGYTDVEVRCADGEYGAPDAAPFDRIIVTVQATDTPPAWTAQLTEGGRLVAPMTLRGVSRPVAFAHHAGVLISDDYETCGFVPMQGVGAMTATQASLHDGGAQLHLDSDQTVDVDALDAALLQPRVEVWSGVMTGRNYTYSEHLDLWLATVLPDFCLLTASKDAVAAGVVEPNWARAGTRRSRTAPAWLTGPGETETRPTARNWASTPTGRLPPLLPNG